MQILILPDTFPPLIILFIQVLSVKQVSKWTIQF